MPEHGPFSTLQEAESTPAVRAIYGKVRDPGSPQGLLRELSSKLVLDACEAAGVELGDQDRATIRFLGNWEPHTCQVIAGLIERAYEAGRSFPATA
jgi:hypothetical protein